jgi:hypothetical protein
MSSQPDPARRTQSRVAAPTTLRWIGFGAPSIEGIQSVTVDPDTTKASEGAPEWLVTNGLGGYACGTMTGLVTRRFHGFLVALRAIISTEEGRARLLEQPDPEGIGEPLAKLREIPARARASGMDV